MNVQRLKDCVKWWQLLLVVVLLLVATYGIVWALVKREVKAELGAAAERIDKSSKAIEEAVEKLVITQTNNNQVTVHPGAEEIVSEAKRRLVDRGIIDD